MISQKRRDGESQDERCEPVVRFDQETRQVAPSRGQVGMEEDQKLKESKVWTIVG